MKRLNVLLLSGAMLLTTATATGLTAVNAKSVDQLIVTDVVEGNRDLAAVKRAASTESALTAEDYISDVKAQVTDEVDGKRDIRFVAAVQGSYRTDEEGAVQAFVPGNYGFKVKINSTTETVAVQSYYNSMSAGSVTYVNALSSVSSTSTIDDFAGKSGYTFFIAITIKGIPTASNDTLLSVTPYCQLDEENTVTGTEKVTNVTSTASGTTVTEYYTMTLGGKTYLMSDATAELGEDSAKAQYKVGGLSVTEGDVIQLALDGTELTDAYYEPLDSNNNLTYNSEANQISIKQTKENVSVYLKCYEDGGYSVWVTGYEVPADVYTMTIGTTTYTLTENTETDTTDGRLAEYMVTGITSVTAGQEVKFFKNDTQLTSTVNFDSNCNLVEVEDTGVATVHNDATNVDVYFKVYPDQDSSSDLIWYVGYMSGYEASEDDNKTIDVAITVTASGWDPVMGNEVYYLWIWGGNYGNGTWVKNTSTDSSTNVVNFTLVNSATAFLIARCDPSNAPTDGTTSWGNPTVWNQSSDVNFVTSQTSYSVSL